jgi:hypothetical protein
MTTALALFTVTAGQAVTITVTQTFTGTITTYNRFIAHLLFTPQ